jgi:hypothetical protein
MSTRIALLDSLLQHELGTLDEACTGQCVWQADYSKSTEQVLPHSSGGDVVHQT